MPRAIWKGSISFGLVNIPVGLYTAESRDEVSFNMLDRKTKSRIHFKRVNEDGKEVAWEDIVKGYEFESGKYVILSDEDLKRASPEATQTIDIVDFVDLDEISPLYFDKPYYLGPDKKGARAYALLREVLRRTNKVGIAKVVIRTRQYLAAVVARGEDVLTLELLRYAHELRDPGELDVPSGKQGISARELEMAERLVEGMVEAWDPEKYKDDYRKDLMKMIEERVEAGELEASSKPVPKPERERSNVVDLMALLKQSVEEGGRKPARGAKKKAAPKKAAAKKTARKPAKKAPAKKKAAARKKSA